MTSVAIEFTATASTVRAEYIGRRTFTVELSTDNDAVSYQLQGVIQNGTETTTKTVHMPSPREIHPVICEAFYQVIDQWFKECPWEQAPMALVRELLRIRKEFHGVWLESL